MSQRGPCLIAAAHFFENLGKQNVLTRFVRLPRDDEELSTLMGQLVMLAARRTPSAAALDAELLRLQIARLDRRISSGDGPVSELAAHRATLKARLDLAVDRAMA